MGDFKTDPIDSFQDAKICVLTDQPGRIFLETDQNSRAFGNVWVPNDAMIFKGSRIALSSSHSFFIRPSRCLWKTRGRKGRPRVSSRRAQFVVSGGTSDVADIPHKFRVSWTVLGLERTDPPRLGFPRYRCSHHGPSYFGNFNRLAINCR